MFQRLTLNLLGRGQIAEHLSTQKEETNMVFKIYGFWTPADIGNLGQQGDLYTNTIQGTPKL